MQRHYPGRQPERRGPSNWQERNERMPQGTGERDMPNEDDSLVPDDRYESAYRLAGESMGPEDWASEWDDRMPSAHGWRTQGQGRSSAAGGLSSTGDGAPDLSRFHGSAARDALRRRQGPKGYTRSDERIREDVCERLAGALEIDVSDVSVQVRDGCVALEGSVPARWMKHGVEDIADSCMCVRDVENRVRVRHAGESAAGQAPQKPPEQTREKQEQTQEEAPKTVAPTPPSVHEEGAKRDRGESHH